MSDPRDGTSEQRLAEVRARLEGVTDGPWFVWDGVEYAGGGRDLCIGAGPEWLANMDHRNCVRRPEHMEAWSTECGRETDAAICSLDGDISAEQSANANFIARAREDVPFLLRVVEYLEREIAERDEEIRRLRYPEDFLPNVSTGAPSPERSV